MLERINKILQKCNYKRLEQQCKDEDTAKEILLESINISEDKQKERRKFFDVVFRQRKNLYIYPEKVNV